MSFAYWNTNIPEEKHTKECPEGLRNLDADDTAQLSMRDEDYKLMSWQEVKKIIRENRLDDFKRTPSDLRRYRLYIDDIRREYGSISEYLLKYRLHWQDTNAKGRPFEDPSDLKIIGNDWPYGIDRDITHICVWTKFTYEEDPRTGDLTDRARALIDGYVDKTFRSEMKADDVAWFKNWSALKSVHAIEHFHVMLYRPENGFIARVTNGDVEPKKRAREG